MNEESKARMTKVPEESSERAPKHVELAGEIYALDRVLDALNILRSKIHGEKGAEHDAVVATPRIDTALITVLDHGPSLIREKRLEMIKLLDEINELLF